MQGETSEGKIVVMGADHNGVAFKARLKNHLKVKGYHCIDVGPYTEKEKVDYVDYARIVGQVVNSGDAHRGVLICGTGVGMSMVANRFPNVRASLVHSVDVARKTREHNDANLLCIGAWVNDADTNLAIADAWFEEKFCEGRHVKRVEKFKEHRPEKIVFTNGVFDILHPGHIALLRFSKSLGGKLVVAINSDRAVKILKGNNRPINNEAIRKAILEGMSFVDEVVIFDDTDPAKIRDEVRPDILVKGSEWTAAEVRARDKVPADIEVKTFPLVMESPTQKYSTTSTVEKMKK